MTTGRAALLALALAAIATTGLTVAVQHAGQRLEHRATRRRAAWAAKARQALPRLLADQAALARDPFFAAARPSGDAGPFLNPRLPWKNLSPPPHRPTLALPPALAKALRRWGPGWPAHAGDPALAHLDLGWMQELTRLGHWDLMSGSRLATLKVHDDLHPPRPDFAALEGWARLRLLRARPSSDFATASAQLRQLAWLAYSTETLAGELAAANILDIARRGHDAFAAQGADVSGWTPWPKARINQLRRASLGAVAYAGMLTPQPLMVRALASPIGRCAALDAMAPWQRMRVTLGVRPVETWARQYVQPQPPCRLDLALWSLGGGAESLPGSLAREVLWHASWQTRLFVKLEPGRAALVLDALAPQPPLDAPR